MNRVDVKHTWIAIIMVMCAVAQACSSEHERPISDKPTPQPAPARIVENYSTATTTRFKDTTADRTDATHDGKSVCNVPENTIVKLSSKPKLVADNKHVQVHLAETIPNCKIVVGYFYGPHLLGDNWLTRVEPTSHQAPVSAADSQVSDPLNGNKGGTTYNAVWGNKIVSGISGTGFSRGRCYEYVAWHLNDAGIISYNDPLWEKVGTRSAYMFGNWAVANISTLRTVFGLRYEPGYNTQPHKAPKGSLLVYQPGQCGYNAVHGHIEIVVSANRACSDFCQNIAKARSGCTPRVFVPVGR